MTFNWNPNRKELSKVLGEVMNNIDVVYNSITMNPNSLDLLKKENVIFSNIYSYFGFIHDITDKVEIKIEINKILKRIELKKKELFTNEKIFDNVINMLNNLKYIHENDIKFLKYLVEEFKKNGVKMSSYNKVKLIDNNINIYTYQNKFLNKLDEEPLFILNKDEVTGLLETFLKEYKRNDKYEIMLNEHTYNHLIENLELREVRKRLQLEYFEKYQGNYKYIQEIVKSRYNVAKLFNYSNYIDYINKDNTLNSKDKILQFLYNLNKVCTPQYEKDIITICQYFDIPQVNDKYILNSWDLPYLINNYKNKKNNIDVTIYEYFPVDKTIEKSILIFGETFKLKFNKITTNIWHPSVIVYEVVQDSKIIGEIYLDLFYRPHKMSGSATVTIKEPLQSCDVELCHQQKGVACVMTNFPVHERNNCFTIQEVSILFHELMHALHIILGKCKYTFLCSNNVEFAFIETFPQLIELWLLDKNVLKSIASHYQTNQLLDDKKIDDLLMYNKSLRSVNVKYQIMLALLDIMLYEEIVAKKLIKNPDDTKQILNDLYEYNFKFVFNTNKIHINFNTNNNPYLIFNHAIHGYSAQYYGYIWSDTIANDLFKMIQSKKIHMDSLINSITSANNYSPTELLKKYFNKNL